MIATLFSAGGSPGVTTAALGLALTRPRPVLLVEATVGSAILAGHLRGAVPHDRGLLDVLAGHRDNTIDSAMDLASIQIPNSHVSVIPGFTDPVQVRGGLGSMWQAMVEVLRRISATGVDVIVDAGRLDSAAFPKALVAGAESSLLVLRTSLRSVAAARTYTPSLFRDVFESTPEALRALIVGGGQPYSANAVCDLLALGSIGQIPWDPDRAAVLSDGASPTRRYESSHFHRALTGLSGALDADASVGVRHG